ncbi:hypothetical protein Pmani_018173 [Petrolisthes manimaculis]|uniref:Uncharacterized protein n=1 Tax=Petrolisthes manimaculis TaxID=1843537 RepID=A0AAE1U4R6_9EUCA|nr:hypothetical protein Pmani_018173 [Petrolisthes manimaculis]
MQRRWWWRRRLAISVLQRSPGTCTPYTLNMQLVPTAADEASCRLHPRSTNSPTQPTSPPTHPTLPTCQPTQLSQPANPPNSPNLPNHLTLPTCQPSQPANSPTQPALCLPACLYVSLSSAPSSPLLPSYLHVYFYNINSPTLLMPA